MTEGKTIFGKICGGVISLFRPCIYHNLYLISSSKDSSISFILGYSCFSLILIRNKSIFIKNMRIQQKG